MRNVVFFKLGGTWDMISKDNALVGSGVLDDKTLLSLEETAGFYKENTDIAKAKKLLFERITASIAMEGENESPLEKNLSFVPNVQKIVRGKFISLFSGDSSHLRASLIAPFVTFLLQYAVKNQTQSIVGAQGTDTADIALLPLLDVYSFDTNLPPFLLTGANRSHREKNSDAPENFADVLKVSQIDLASGAYWIFAARVFKASDLVKISPLESRIVDSFSTFYSPHLKAEKVEDVLKEKEKINRKKYVLSEKHIIHTITAESLFTAMEQVHIVDLSLQNRMEKDMEAIMDTSYKAVVIAAHAFGNVSNPIKFACVQAALKNKIVIVCSRCLISEVNKRYGASLLQVNEKELRDKSQKIISAQKLNKNIAKALATRAVHENLTNYEVQQLFFKFAASRHLSEEDVVVPQ
jgi:L-asparaginase/Glu-tRNA(Gln) amidotransferase subunit D